jgi:hypothetical protein
MADRCGVLPSATEQNGQTSVLTLFMAVACLLQVAIKAYKIEGFDPGSE